ncbi:hypothetical protein HELRODRAFT_172390 [Helobdella robusta]|uniref:Uncharacterized protein n=1 Tax=Helobdella robusta TaxID=6412 RepID=T1F588_HELRO|nr:hypothetical protein HELRODRAFT_172390 [Helobdella robusta]ESO04715.1 hypothetical protein HELRODRAFT_172390 [Helobdella robusta]
MVRQKFEKHLSRGQYTSKVILKIMNAKQPVFLNLQRKNAKFDAIVKETSNAVVLSNIQKEQIQIKIRKLQKLLDKQLLEKYKIKGEIAEKMRDGMMEDTVLEKMVKQLHHVQTSTRISEQQIIYKESQIAHLFARLGRQQIVNDSLQRLLSKLQRQVANKSESIARAKCELARLESSLHNTNAQMVQLQKKLDRLLEQSGVWLADQANLIRKLKDRDNEWIKINEIKKELRLMNIKKIRVQGEIKREGEEIAETIRCMRVMDRDVTKLNCMIANKRLTYSESHDSQKFLLNYFEASIKEEKSRYFDLQLMFNRLLDEKQAMVEELLEIEKQILLWERKVHVAREMKATFATLTWVDEINTMKNEIWKMEQRRSVLKREIEKMHRCLEKLAVSITIQTLHMTCWKLVTFEPGHCGNRGRHLNHYTIAPHLPDFFYFVKEQLILLIKL